MARTRRASTRRKSTRRTSTRRTSTSRARTRRPATRRTSTRRTSARRTPTRRRKQKGLRLTRKSQKQILIALAVVVALILLIAFLQNTRVRVEQRRAGTVGEYRRNAVYGRVTSINVGPARKAIRVKSLNTGKVYTFYVGWRTKFYPDRWPSAGERVKVYYLYDRGYLKATRVYIQ